MRKYLININIKKNNGVIDVEDIPEIMEIIRKHAETVMGSVVVISGRLPVWLYGVIIHFFHPTRGLAVFDPRKGGGIIIVSHDKNFKIGDVISVDDCIKIDIEY